ncbi:Pentatricopeptide repeat [Dillenia turbinata]|uniref:Pentatricopeptide repeat n=1 Tax=Dillenia turbinata TaxID=194707 RepID=A0AAN8ZSS1_9MAGN
MRRLSKFPSFASTSVSDLCSYFTSLDSQFLHLSFLSTAISKPLQSKHTQKIHKSNREEDTKNLTSLFTEITHILGTETFPITQTHIGISRPEETTQLGETEKQTELPFGSHDVCRNVYENNRQGNVPVPISGDTQMEILDGNEASEVIQRIAEIVRSENGGVSMGKRLEHAGFVFDSDTVNKVLKRCFKVPNMALRFFHWVKSVDGYSHTTSTYNTMIYIVGQAKEFDQVENLLKEMEKNSCVKDVKTWTILVLLYGKAKLIGKALSVFEKMRKSGCEPDAAAYRLMIRSLCIAQKADLAWEYYKEMIGKGFSINVNLYKLLLNCLSRSGDISAIHLVADDLIKLSEISAHDAYAHVLKSLCISGRIREALELIRELRSENISLEPEDFRTLLKGLCKAQRTSDALEILDIMEKKNIVDAKVYGIVIDGFLRCNNVPKALQLFESMKEQGHLPSTPTYTELMQHLFKLNEYGKGCSLYDEMLENGVQIDTIAVTAMIAGHVQQNCVSKAWEVFKGMEERSIKPTPKCYEVFIKELCKISGTDEILKVLDAMLVNEMIISKNVFNTVISYLEKKGEREKIKAVKKMQNTCGLNYCAETSFDDVADGPGPDSDLNSNNTMLPVTSDINLVEPLPKSYNEHDLQQICGILSSSKDWSLMQETLEECSIQFTPELVVEIMHNCSLQGRAALQFFSWVGKRPGYVHTTETYNMAIKISGRGKDFKHMRSLFNEMRRKGCVVTSDTWTIMLMQYGRVGLTKIALKNFREMKYGCCKPNGSTYKYMILSLCGRRGRKVDEAIQLFNEMVKARHVPDRELVETYLGCLCEVGNSLDAQRCIDSLRKVGFPVSLSYSLLVRALCRAGKIEEALATADKVGEERTSLDHYTYGSVIHGLLRRGQLEEALAKIDAMRQVGILPTVHVYTSLIVHFFKDKQIERALEVLGKMREEGCEPTTVTYSALIRGYMNIGKVNDAWNVFHRMKSKGPLPDFKTYSMFINCLCKEGRSEEAMHLLSDMLESGIAPSTINFRTVFYGLNREGKHDLAKTVIHRKTDLKRKRQLST